MLVVFIMSALAAQPRTVESIVPALAYSPACTTTIDLWNLSDRPVDVVLQPHRESGALVPVVGRVVLSFQLPPGAKRSFSPRIPETTENAWVAVREIVPEVFLPPVVSVGGTTSCSTGEQLHNALREVAHAGPDPWFDGDAIPGAKLAVVNDSESPAVVNGCYSNGTLVNNPNVPGEAALTPLCSHRIRDQIPAFSARQYPLQHEGNSHFSLHVIGPAVALQLLRLLDVGTQLYQVDSSIAFGNPPPF